MEKWKSRGINEEMKVERHKWRNGSREEYIKKLF